MAWLTGLFMVCKSIGEYDPDRTAVDIRPQQFADASWPCLTFVSFDYNRQEWLKLLPPDVTVKNEYGK